MKDTTSIREMLFKQMDSLAKKEISAKEAKAFSGLAAQVVYTIRLEIENKKTELELAKSNEDVKKWMAKDFSSIQNIKVGRK